MSTITKFITDNPMIVVLSVFSILMFVILLSVILTRPIVKKSSQVTQGDTPETKDDESLEEKDAQNDEDANTVIFDERKGKKAQFINKKYKQDDEPIQPKLPFPDGRSYWVFIKRHDKEELEPVTLKPGARWTPEDLWDADDDIDTPRLFPNRDGFWQKALVGELMILIIILVIYAFATMK